MEYSVHIALGVPEVHIVVVWINSVYSNVTPVAFIGSGNCLYTYSIHSLMLSSDTAATPFGKRIFIASSGVPGDMSVTVPLSITLFPVVIAVIGASTVMALGPLPLKA